MYTISMSIEVIDGSTPTPCMILEDQIMATFADFVDAYEWIKSICTVVGYDLQDRWINGSLNASNGRIISFYTSYQLPA